MAGIKEYRDKRDFSKTSEPEHDNRDVGEARPVFVVQKHDASHLHYDFRMEIGGVLKSWAVPKGPSMDPHTKRLAIMTEDHPLGYENFEGVIPEGNYGAGTVKVWDSGWWEPADGFGDASNAIKKGLLEFFLYGKKLKGEFVLVKTKGSYAKNGWLLIKKEDEHVQHTEHDVVKA